MRESDLGWMFSEIGTPSGLGLRRDKRERVLEQLCEHTILEVLSVDATKDLMMRICYK